FTTDCGYDKVISVATTEAKNAGANIIQIVQLKDPSTFGSSCYRLKAKLYRNLDPESLANMIYNREQRNKSRLPAGSDYALIHFYRPSSGLGALLGYKIKDENDSIVGRFRNGEKFIYKTKKFGTRSFHATLETKEEISINVQKGKEYFVRCGVDMGIVLGRPDIKIIANYLGIMEFEAMEN
ncbi:MAG TPA: hypothetical protein VFI78_01625, partial [Salinimicrobium sp.]|nr:hypothetical protein [Salinimicrobium sp.]